MESYALRPGLFHCIVRERIVFLDLPANRYFSLNSSLSDAFRRLAAGEEPPEASGEIDRLVDLNVITRSARAETITPVVMPDPESSILDHALPKASVVRTLWFLLHEMRILLSLRSQPLHRIFAVLARQRCERLNDSDGLAVARAVLAEARAADNLLTAYNRCLSRSIAQFDAMCRRGYRPTLLIGVADTRFGAHCWLQDGDVVINDEVDVVRLYTPILAI